MAQELSKTQMACLEWLADPKQEFGMPGGKRTMQSLADRQLAKKIEGRWTITDVGLLELGPIVLTGDGFKKL